MTLQAAFEKLLRRADAVESLLNWHRPPIVYSSAAFSETLYLVWTSSAGYPYTWATEIFNFTLERGRWVLLCNCTSSVATDGSSGGEVGMIINTTTSEGSEEEIVKISTESGIGLGDARSVNLAIEVVSATTVTVQMRAFLGHFEQSPSYTNLGYYGANIVAFPG